MAGIRILLAVLVLAVSAAPLAAQPAATTRQKVGVALGGGSARGIAHVGVLRWLEEHKIPIDVIAGTSMGGLIGGSYATGMTPDDIEAMLSGIDWDSMFGSSHFEFSNVRRKRDLREYPSRLEFGIKKGLVPPPSLNNGQQVDLLLSRIAAPYYAIRTFDELPTPFRCVAVDLTKAQPVVMGDGSLARAMRATMSLPLVFPAVMMDDKVLVDGGAMNNIPGDVVRGMGADRVIAVNVGDLEDRTTINNSLFGLAMETLDAMMRANTLKASAGVNVMINVPLKEYGSLDWRRAPQLIAEGYKAAEAMSDRLLPFAVSEAEFEQWRTARQSARRTTLPSPAFVEIEGAAPSDAGRMRRELELHLGQPLVVSALDETLQELGGLDRYEALSWTLIEQGGSYGLRINARPKSYGPPFFYLGLNLENTTGNEFRFGLNGRYLAFDVLGSGSELRIDGAVGSDPSAGFAWYRPLGSSRLFVEPGAFVLSQSLGVISEGHTIASYSRTRLGAGIDLGVNLGRLDEVRAGMRYGWIDASVNIGDPGLPEVDGEDSVFIARWTHDGQDRVVTPSRGTHSRVELRRYVSAPFADPAAVDGRTTDDVSQLEGGASWITSLDAAARRRVFLVGAAGTSFDGRPLPTEQFALGGPLRMSALTIGQERGDHYAHAAVGYLHQIMRLPDFLGGAVFLGAWVETGSAFSNDEDADVGFNASTGVIGDTILGPVFFGFAAGADGSSRFYLAIGKVFR